MKIKKILNNNVVIAKPITVVSPLESIELVDLQSASTIASRGSAMLRLLSSTLNTKRIIASSLKKVYGCETAVKNNSQRDSRRLQYKPQDLLLPF